MPRFPSANKNMQDIEKNKRIYVIQFNSGSVINLLPLAAGQLISRLKQEEIIRDHCQIEEIVFRRPVIISDFVKNLKDPIVVGFSCYLWNISLSLEVAKEVRKAFPQALIMIGGPSVIKDPELISAFFHEHPYIDLICLGEGEESFTKACIQNIQDKCYETIPGVIFHDRATGKIIRTHENSIAILDKLPSPFIDGTFDDFYNKYGDELTGIIWETNRGCPFRCAFCTWGNQPLRKVIEKPWEMVKEEIEWIGRHQIAYVNMTDANFGIRKRDIAIAQALADCREKYGVPRFISVSWAKNSPDNVLKIAQILRQGNIGFRITKALQSYNEEALTASRRANVHPEVFRKMRERYYSEQYYTYTELILGLPKESYSSFIHGIESALSDSVYEQLYVYPLFLFPNTEMALSVNREKFGIISRLVPLRYTKCQVLNQENYHEKVEMVVGTQSMPLEDWVKSFTDCYYTLALHDDRLAFFILQYLKREHKIAITDFIVFIRLHAFDLGLSYLTNSIERLRCCAIGCQEANQTHIIEPQGYGGVPYDPPDAIFLELLLEKERFYSELRHALESYLNMLGIGIAHELLDDLFLFQSAVMAHPHGLVSEKIDLQYDWLGYFSFAFHLNYRPLVRKPARFKVYDPKPSYGDNEAFLANHFDVRGVPAFFELYDQEGCIVFPEVPPPELEI